MSKIVDCKCSCGCGKAEMVTMKTEQDDVSPHGYVHLRCIKCGAKTEWMQMAGTKWSQQLQDAWKQLQERLEAKAKFLAELAATAPKTERTILVPVEVRLVTYEDYILRRVREGGIIVLKKEVVKTSVGQEIVREMRLPISEARQLQHMTLMAAESVTRERLVTVTRKAMKREKRAIRKERDPADATV